HPDPHRPVLRDHRRAGRLHGRAQPQPEPAAHAADRRSGVRRFLGWLFAADQGPGPDMVAGILAGGLVLTLMLAGGGLIYKNLIWNLDFSENATQLVILIVTSLVGVFAGYLGARRSRRPGEPPPTEPPTEPPVP